MKKAILSVTVILLIAAFAHAATFKSPDGYSFDHPDAWTVMDKSDREAAEKAAREKGLELPSDTANKVSCLLANPTRGKSGFAANVDVLITKGAPTVSESALREVKDSYPDKMKKMNIQSSNVQGSIIKAAGYDAISITALNRIPGVAQPVKQWQIMIPAGGKTYIVTCTAAAREFAANEAAFKQVIDSLKVPAGMPGWLNGAIIGGVVGGIAGGVITIVKKRRAKTATPTTPSMPPAA